MLQYQFKKTIPPLVIEGFKRDANKLIKHDAQSAYDLLGVIASLENKRENVISNYKKLLVWEMIHTSIIILQFH